MKSQQNLRQFPISCSSFVLLSVAACGAEPYVQQETELELADATPDGNGASTETDVAEADSSHDGQSELEPDALSMLTCAAEVAWQRDERPMWNDPAIFAFTPADGMLWLSHFDQWPGTVVRAADGELLATPGMDEQFSVMSVNPAWSKRITIAQTGEATLADFITGSSLATLPSPTQYPGFSRFSFAPNGRVFAATFCDPTDENYRSVVRLHDATSGDILAEIARPGTAESCYNYGDRELIAWNGSEELFFARPSSAEVERLSVDGELLAHATVVSSVMLEAGTEFPVANEPNVIEMRVAGDFLLTTGSDGVVRRWNTETLESAGELGNVAVHVLNRNRYAPPVLVAPIAVSGDGSFFAVATSRNTVALRDLEGHEISTFSFEFSGGEFSEAEYDAIGALVFNAEDTRLGIAHSGGLALAACPNQPPVAENHNFSVRLTGPSEMVLGETATFLATHAGSNAPHVHRFLVDGEQGQAAVFTREFAFTPTTTGTFEITAEIEDGNHFATESTFVTVVP